MGLPVPPTTLFKFARVLWFLGNAADVFRPHLFDYWQGLASSGDLVWMRFAIKAEDNTSTIAADDQHFKIDIVNYTGGAIDTSWTDADLDTCANRISENLLTPWLPHMQSTKAFTLVSAYRMTFADLPPPAATDWATFPKYLESGPPVKEWVVNWVGQAATYQAPQVRSTVTLETPLRSHWGRFYLPFPAGALCTSSGRIAQTDVTSIATMANNLFGNLAASEFYPVIPSTQDQKKPIRALQSVSGIRVDDVFDIQRRGRSKFANFRVRHDIDNP